MEWSLFFFKLFPECLTFLHISDFFYAFQQNITVLNIIFAEMNNLKHLMCRHIFIHECTFLRCRGAAFKQRKTTLH